MKTLNYDYFYQSKHDHTLHQWLESIAHLVQEQSRPARHGHFPKWLDALHSLPPIDISTITLDEETVSAQSDRSSTEQQAFIKESLLRLLPWRKGPFNINGVFIDSEWRSNLKWARLEKHIAPLKNRTVLDVGCGNGYYGFRMLGAGAKTVVGIDPGELFCTQFFAINHFIKTHQLAVLPLSGEMVFDHPFPFETVFSMGVLGHRRDPQEHLQGLHKCLAHGGQLVLETLVIDRAASEQLNPERYANMRNVWTLPSVPLLLEQIQQAGFSNGRCIDICRTTVAEQRPTEWMPSYSLQNGLNPSDHTLTVEGHPSPTRAIVLAEKM